MGSSSPMTQRKPWIDIHVHLAGVGTQNSGCWVSPSFRRRPTFVGLRMLFGITDLQIMKPSEVDAFTKSAFNAIKLTNPTVPLPLEFPDPNAPFIVTFYFNETPPGGGGS